VFVKGCKIVSKDVIKITNVFLTLTTHQLKRNVFVIWM